MRKFRVHERRKNIFFSVKSGDLKAIKLVLLPFFCVLINL